MGKASRNRRRAAAVRARRARSGSPFWYAATGLIVFVGVIAIALSRGGSAQVHPFGTDHWHAALGVYICDHWEGDGTWPWPAQTPSGTPARAGSSTYSGLHSHNDGLIHIEPQTTDETGKHATVGTYFKFGGWKLSATQVDFLTQKKQNGDKCGATPGVVRWSVNGKEMQGNPASYKLKDHDVIAVAFVPKSKKLKDLGQPPSAAHLQDPSAGESGRLTPTTLPGGTAPTTVPGAPTTVPGAPTTVPPTTTSPTTIAP